MEGTPFGRYRLVEVLGRGGMGEVWRAFDTVTERTVAVKVLPAHLAGDEGFQKRFLREAKAAASLNEPHVVPIYDFGEIDDRLFVAMRLVDGHDLQTLLTHGPLSPERAVTIIEQVAAALQAAHGIGLVHRDVKPSNILVGDDDFAYLIDFGIARVAGETGLTSTGMTLGTWPYMAPERFRTGVADARADVYSLTCVLHQALTGQQPFPGESLEQIATGHMFDPPPRPSAIQSSVPAAMDNVIAVGMAKDLDERYATTRALAQAARAALPVPVSHATIAAAFAATQDAAAVPTTTGPRVHAAAAPTQLAPVHEPIGSDHTPGPIVSPRPTEHVAAAPRNSLRIPVILFAACSVIVGLLIVFAQMGDSSSPDKVSAPPRTSPTTRPSVPSPVVGPQTSDARDAAIQRKYDLLDAPSKQDLGSPLGSVQHYPDGSAIQQFQGAAFVTYPGGTYVVWGKLRDKWYELGGPLGELGYPISDELYPPGGGPRYSRFEHGTITWRTGDIQATVNFG